ncbi:hypothetical protein [Micromonospora echinospora]
MTPRSRDDIAAQGRAVRACGGDPFSFREQVQLQTLEIGVNVPDWQWWLLLTPSEGADL